MEPLEGEPPGEEPGGGWAAPLRFVRGAEASPAASNGEEAGACHLSRSPAS